MAPTDYSRWDRLALSDDDDDVVDDDKQSQRPQPSAAAPALELPVAKAPAICVSSASAPSNLFDFAPFMSGQGTNRAAIASTMKDVAERIDSWVRWHVWIGFERLYLFFDDPNEVDSMALARVAGGSAVSIIPRDEALRREWARQPSWVGHKDLVDKEVQVRQALNVQYAMACAKREGIVWLLNIDSDELFLPEPRAGTGGAHGGDPMAARAADLRGAVAPLFEGLAAAGIEAFAFMNHEVVPEMVPEIDPSREASSRARGDPFRSLSLFKRSQAVVPQTAEAAECIAGWKRRQTLPVSEENHFLYCACVRMHPLCPLDGPSVPPKRCTSACTVRRHAWQVGRALRHRRSVRAADGAHVPTAHVYRSMGRGAPAPLLPHERPSQCDLRAKRGAALKHPPLCHLGPACPLGQVPPARRVPRRDCGSYDQGWDGVGADVPHALPRLLPDEAPRA